MCSRPTAGVTDSAQQRLTRRPGDPARRVVSFEDPDGAYLAAAALKRYLDASVVSDAILIPTNRGPALQIPADAAKLRVLRAIVRE